MSEGPVHILSGPGLNVNREGLRRWCGEWTAELGVPSECVFADDTTALDSSIRNAGEAGARGAIIAPGPQADAAAVAGLVRETGLEVVWVDTREAERPRPACLDDITIAAIRGRGVFGYRWALQYLLQRLSWPYTVIPYGPERDQVGDLRLPAQGQGPFPVAVFLHGGFWRERWERDTIEPLAIDLARRGYATWNLEYRRVGPFGGGWPNTCADTAAGIDALADIAEQHPLDLTRVVLVGHSAGSHLALWAVKRQGIDTDVRVRPHFVVSLAGVADLVECALRGLGDTGDAVADLMNGEPEERPDEYQAASPILALPLGVPQLVVQGRLDSPDLVDMSRIYVGAAVAAGDEIEYVELDDADHFHLIVPTSHAWPPILERIERWRANGR